MKRTTREKNTIIITFIFYFILILGVIWIILFNTIWKISEVEAKKIDTQKLYEELSKIKKEWINFNEFKNISTDNETDKVILSNITSDFYNKYLKNNWSTDFDTFINKKKKELNSEENIKLIEKNKSQIINILPTYSENNINIWWDKLSDFKFVNYIESIVDSFNLSIWWSIGIWNVVLLDEYAVSSNWWDSLESSIFYIPLNITVKGTKSNIIDFLYFIEHVWNIEINNNKINVVRDYKNFLSVNWFPKILSWDKYIKDYNIFENQITDISKISIPEYIDWSYISRGDKDFVDFIKKTQWNDEFEVKVNLNFYVKWQPKYEILKFIKSVTNNFKLLNSKVNQLISWNKVKWAKLIDLKKKQNLLKNLNTKVVNINKELRKQKDLEQIYKNAIEINKFIEPLCNDLKWVCK